MLFRGETSVYKLVPQLRVRENSGGKRSRGGAGTAGNYFEAL